MRFRSEQTVIRYAGAVVLGIGQRFGQDEFARTQEYTTQAVQVLGAVAPVLDSYGNAQGSTDFSVALDFDTPEEIKADPEGFVILDRADLEPYFPDYMPTKSIQLLILALLESFRRKNA